MKRRKNPINTTLMARMILLIKFLNIYFEENSTYVINKTFSSILSSKSVKLDEFCDDCDNIYTKCICEGDREISGPCRYCKQNYCICDYNLETEEDVIREIANLAKLWFDENQMGIFEDLIKEQMDPKLYITRETKQRFEKLLSLIERKSNLKKYEKKKIYKKKKTKSKRKYH